VKPMTWDRFFGVLVLGTAYALATTHLLTPVQNAWLSAGVLAFAVGVFYGRRTR